MTTVHSKKNILPKKTIARGPTYNMPEKLLWTHLNFGISVLSETSHAEYHTHYVLPLSLLTSSLINPIIFVISSIFEFVSLPLVPAPDKDSDCLKLLRVEALLLSTIVSIDAIVRQKLQLLSMIPSIYDVVNATRTRSKTLSQDEKRYFCRWTGATMRTVVFRSVLFFARTSQIE